VLDTAFVFCIIRASNTCGGSMREVSSARARELGDQVHKLQQRMRDLRKELEELKGQHAVYTRRLVDAMGGEEAYFASSDGFIKVVEFDYEADPEDQDDLDIPAMIAMIRAARRRVPLKQGVKVVVRYALNNERLD
jgi:hypothetical protein